MRSFLLVRQKVLRRGVSMKIVVLKVPKFVGKMLKAIFRIKS